MIGISHIATCFPGNSRPLHTLMDEEALTQAQQDYFLQCGIEEVYVSDYSAYQLAFEASEKVLTQNQIARDQIGHVLLIEPRLPEQLISSPAARLHHELGLEDAQVTTISGQGCTDMTMALRLARDLMIANYEYEYVLIAFGNKPYTPSRFRHPVTVFGDGGVAVLLSRDEQATLEEIAIKTQGRYWDLFSVPFQGGSFDTYEEVCKDERSYSFELALESRNVFTTLNQQVLDGAGLRMTDIDHVLMQNISSRAMDFYEDALGTKISEVCRVNLKKYGHLGPADIMVNLQTGLEHGVFHKGQRLLIMNNSPVAAWSAAVVTI